MAKFWDYKNAVWPVNLRQDFIIGTNLSQCFIFNWPEQNYDANIVWQYTV